MQEAVKADEPGCLLYSLCRDRDDATTYRVMEQYSDDAVKVHGKSDGFKAAAAGLAGVLSGAPEVVLSKLSANRLPFGENKMDLNFSEQDTAFRQQGGIFRRSVYAGFAA